MTTAATFSQIAFNYRADRPAMIVALQAMAAANYVTPATDYLSDRFAVRPGRSAEAAAKADALMAELFDTLAA
jgi:hypothetical protein